MVRSKYNRFSHILFKKLAHKQRWQKVFSWAASFRGINRLSSTFKTWRVAHICFQVIGLHKSPQISTKTMQSNQSANVYWFNATLRILIPGISFEYNHKAAKEPQTFAGQFSTGVLCFW